MNIVIDPGHGGYSLNENGFGKYGGAYYADNEDLKAPIIYEKNIALQVGLLVGAWLNQSGHEVEFTRDYDKKVGLKARCDIANKENQWNKKADLFVSIHVDWWKEDSAKGTTIFYHENSTNGKSCAKKVSKQLDKWKAISNRATKPSDDERDRDLTPYLYVLDNTVMPAILVECGFLSNPKNRAVLTSQEGILALSFCIHDGINQWCEKQS